jgi:hypothetical protein
VGELAREDGLLDVARRVVVVVVEPNLALADAARVGDRVEAGCA